MSPQSRHPSTPRCACTAHSAAGTWPHGRSCPGTESPATGGVSVDQDPGVAQRTHKRWPSRHGLTAAVSRPAATRWPLWPRQMSTATTTASARRAAGFEPSLDERAPARASHPPGREAARASQVAVRGVPRRRNVARLVSGLEALRFRRFEHSLTARLRASSDRCLRRSPRTRSIRAARSLLTRRLQ